MKKYKKLGKVYPPLEGGVTISEWGKGLERNEGAEEWEKNSHVLMKGTMAIRVMMEETHSERNDSTTEMERDLLTAQTMSHLAHFTSLFVTIFLTIYG